jgi:hypothetical protein
LLLGAGVRPGAVPEQGERFDEASASDDDLGAAAGQQVDLREVLVDAHRVRVAIWVVPLARRTREVTWAIAASTMGGDETT